MEDMKEVRTIDGRNGMDDRRKVRRGTTKRGLEGCSSPI